MQIYMATMENTSQIFDKLPDNYVKYGLISYFYLGKKDEKFDLILSKCEKVLVDSGAHSFQHGLGGKESFLDFTKRYAKFIEKYTNHPKVEGFFEMDIDNIEPYEKVLEYRAILEKVSDKIIPVWHNNRGIEDFIEMCKKYSGKRISITGFRNNDIIDSQYNLFINTAHHYGAKIHILGMTRFNFMKSLNFKKDDSVDSSSWRQQGAYGRISGITHNHELYRFLCLSGLRIRAMHFHKLNFLTGVSFQRSLDS